MSRRARAQAPVRRRLAVAAIAAAVVAAGCFASGSSGSLSAHHDDPFLTCVRQRESGDNYRIDSASGLYHGAYQFLQATWDATASHIGAFDLVGVDPHTASPTLQDDMAWALYQWQGTQPWAGDDC